LDEALRQAAVQPPAETQEILSQHIAATPVIEIVSPQPGALIREGSAIVTARIAVPAPGALVRAKLFANGVVAPQQRLIREQAVAGGTERVYEWSVALPNDPQNLIQLVAGTDAPTAALASVLIERGRTTAAAVDHRGGRQSLRRSRDRHTRLLASRCRSHPANVPRSRR
jgi:hypothetical protein